jgi:hypothetical protein
MRLLFAAAAILRASLALNVSDCSEDLNLLQLSVGARPEWSDARDESSDTHAEASPRPLSFASVARDTKAETLAEVTTGIKGGGDHDSIFLLKLADGLLQRALWWIIIIMLVYTIMVDRAQALANYLAQGDRCDEMFVQRVYAELQIFGLVAISLFIGQNLIGRMPVKYFVLFEFTDILCSMGACSLIVVGVVMHIYRKKLERSWTTFRNLDDLHGKMNEDASTAHDYDQGFLDFYVMAAHFRLNNNVPTDFDFFLYMRESLSQNICFLININWITWIAMLACAIMTTTLVYFSPAADDPHLAVLAFAAACWSVAAGILAIYVWLTRSMSELRQQIGSSPERVEACWRQCVLAGGGDVSKQVKSQHDLAENPGLLKRLHFDEKLAELLKQSSNQSHEESLARDKRFGIGVCQQLLQILSLLACFQIALYVMTVAYNIKAEDMNALWHLVSIVGFSASMLYLLPMAISVLALIQGYSQPDPDVLDAVIDDSKAFERDCEYVKDQIRELTSKPELRKKLVDTLKEAGGDVRDNKINFQDLLQEIHINVGERRLRRLMRYLDEDRDGTISVDEFIRGVGATDIASAVKQAHGH